MAIRAFVAIEMPQAVAAGLREVITELRPRFEALPLRWVPVENIHLTLKFLGDIPEERISPISEALHAQTQGVPPFDVALNGIGVFPAGRKPHVLWIGLQSNDHLNELQRRMETALKPLGYPSEARPFSPHLTLARVRRGANFTDLKRIGELASATKLSSTASGKVDSVTLFRSELKPGGSVYNALSRSPLSVML